MNITCPSCKKVLKSSVAVPAGKAVKCPGCQTVFAAPAEDQATPATVQLALDATQAIQGSPPLKPAVKGPEPRKDADKPRRRDDEKNDDRPRRRRRRDDDEEDDDRPRRKRRREGDDDKEEDEKDRPRRRKSGEGEDDDKDEDDDDRPRRKKRRDDDKEREEDEEDRPRRKRRRDDEDDEDDDDDRPRRSRGRRKRKKSGVMLFVGLGVGGVALAALVVTAFVWPGFLLFGGGGSGGSARMAALRYFSAETRVVAGIDFIASGNSLYKKPIQDFASNVIFFDEPDLANILKDSQWVLFGGDPAKNDDVTFVIQSPTDNDAEKVRKAFNAEAAEKLKGGQSVYRVKKRGGHMEGLVYMPTPKQIVFASSSNDNFATLLEKTTPVLPANMVDQIRRVSGSAIWAVISTEGEFSKRIGETQEQFRKIKKITGKAPFEGADEFMSTMAAAKFLIAVGNVAADAKSVKLEYSVVLGSAAEAARAHTELAPKIKAIAGITVLMPGAPKDLAKDLESLKVEAVGANLTISATFSESVVTELGKKIEPPRRR